MAEEDFYVPEEEVCECEIDWRCGMHQGQYTALELQYDAYASAQTELDAMHGM